MGRDGQVAQSIPARSDPAAIGAIQMMLTHLGEVDAASAVERGMSETFPRLKGMGGGEMGYSTSEVGDMVATSVSES